MITRTTLKTVGIIRLTKVSNSDKDSFEVWNGNHMLLRGYDEALATKFFNDRVAGKPIERLTQWD